MSYKRFVMEGKKIESGKIQLRDRGKPNHTIPKAIIQQRTVPMLDINYYDM